MEITSESLLCAIQNALKKAHGRKSDEEHITKIQLQAQREKFLIRLYHNLLSSRENVLQESKLLSIPLNAQGYLVVRYVIEHTAVLSEERSV